MPDAETEATSERIAIVDIGSNTIKHSVFDVTDRAAPRLVASDAETVRLGADIDANGAIGEERAERAILVLQGFGTEAARLGASDYIGVATEAFRGAGNGPAVLARLEKRTPWRLRVIDGIEEARLTFRGLQPVLDGFAACLVADIGGASTELLHVVAGQLVHSLSVPVGSGRFADIYYRGARPTPPSLASAREAARAAVTALLPPGAATLPLVLSGGNGVFLDRLWELIGWQSGLSVPALEMLLDDLGARPATDLAAMLAISVERADVLPAGCAIALGIADAAKPSHVVPAPSGIREGLLRDWLEAQGLSAPGDDLPDLSGQRE